ncbi:MAG: cobyrinate a,c-diamide synthase [Burkholderiaceae bacterium]
MPKATCPAILVAAPASGQGKTTVACALARLYSRQGLKVRVFKCGPDFLDPYWLELASGAPVFQLDLWMTGEADCAQRLHDAAGVADLIIVEGVMGLYDGDPSAADLAQHFGLHVLAVIDAGAMAGTFGALAYGLQTYRDGLQFAGVLANRVASTGHAEMLKVSLRDPQQWQGALMRDVALTLPERHLGLVMSTELADAMARLDAAADALATTPLGQKNADDLNAWAVTFTAPEFQSIPIKRLSGQTIAVAKDAAFCFIYTANIDCLLQLGAEVVCFSPLNDVELPPCDALWLPGGYPELYTQTLASNKTMAASIRQHVQNAKPVWAECGGMMALFESIQTVDGVVHPMWGLLPGHVTMQKRLAALGPQQFEAFDAPDASFKSPDRPDPPEPLRGHTFHYSTCSTDLQPITRTQAAPGKTLRGEGEALYQAGSIRASYFHAWFASSPAAAARLFLKDAE